MSAYRWSFHFGGEPDSTLVDYDVTGQWQNYGYQAEDFWGSEIRTDFGRDRVIETFSYGWVRDDQGTVLTDSGGDPVRHRRDSWMRLEGGPKPGVYVHIVPWMFPVRVP